MGLQASYLSLLNIALTKLRLLQRRLAYSARGLHGSGVSGCRSQLDVTSQCRIVLLVFPG